MDAASDAVVRELVAMFASQTAKTELIQNIVGHRVHLNPGPMLGVWPTDRMATSYSKDRLGPMCRDTPVLRDLIQDKRTARVGSGTSEVLEKKYPGGLFALTGANSAAGLAMRPIRDLYCDETDRFPLFAGGKGGDEGSPIELARKRTSNFDDSLEVYTSSPGAKGRSAIAARYELSDKNRWWVACPYCGEDQVLGWGGVDFRDAELEKDELEALTNEERAARARYRCEHCSELWDDADRWDAALAGRWIPDAPGVKARRGFWINCLVSPWLTLAALVEEWLAAQGDSLALQVFVNTRLAELWDDSGERVEPDSVLARLEPYPASSVPRGILLVTAGADVQQNPPRIEVTRYGWGISGEVWALDHHVISGDPATILESRDDSRLDDLLLRGQFTREDGAPLRVAASCIDSQGGFYEEVLAYSRSRSRRHVYAIRGRAGETVPLWPLKATQVKRKRLGRAALYNVGVDQAKGALLRAIKLERPEDWEPGTPIPGFIHYPQRPEFDEEYFAQLVGEYPKPVRLRGRIRLEWIQEYPRVEALDCFVYARAAVAALNPNWGRLQKTRERDAEKNRELDEADVLTDEQLDQVDDADELPDPPPRKKRAKPKKSAAKKPTRDPRGPRRGGRRRGGFATNY